MISEIVESIRAQMHETLSGLGEKLPTFGVGVAAAKKFKSKPSIVFIPETGTIAPPSMRGADPGALCDRTVACMAELYSDDVDSCEELAGHLVAAMHDALTAGSFRVVGEKWDTSGATPGGQIMGLEVQFLMQFTREAEKTADVDTIPEMGSVLPLEIGA